MVPPNDADATLQALLRLLNDPALRASLAHAARDWVQDNASLDALRRRYDALYQLAMSD